MFTKAGEKIKLEKIFEEVKILTHVFIVNDRTFVYHLKYLFAGTCSSTDAVFLEKSNYINPKRKDDGLTARQELTIAGMIADVSRIRPGDKIIFYLTQSQNHEGMFFGVFRVKGAPFFDPNENNYLKEDLGIALNFRVLIEPEKVYPFGISEHDALDSLKNISHPSQMCWSMIYRKLKGKRGCTMITDYESEQLIKKISAVNKKFLSGKNFTFNEQKNCIEIDGNSYLYKGGKKSLDLKSRIIYKASKNLAYEAHLQAYVVANCDEMPLKKLTNQKVGVPLWIGNEVSCGVGMQSVDVMLSQETAGNVFFNIIELKCVEPYESIITYQLPRYISWVEDYLAPLYKKNVVITPIILAKKFSKPRNLSEYLNECRAFNYQSNKVTLNPLSYIGYKISDDIDFEKIL